MIMRFSHQPLGTVRGQVKCDTEVFVSQREEKHLPERPSTEIPFVFQLANTFESSELTVEHWSPSFFQTRK